MMIVDNKFEIAQIVYLITDNEQLPRIVTAITIRQLGLVYELSQGASTSSHFDYEISTEKELILT
jgi:hypothetical protein